MTAKESFLQLSMVQQMLLIMDKGYTLLARKEEAVSIKLFELNGFYVEVKYHSIENRIVSIEIVELEEVTDAYLANIKIENLF
jgi:hypothetical protein